jgi:hypothetical protein
LENKFDLYSFSATSDISTSLSAVTLATVPELEIAQSLTQTIASAITPSEDPKLVAGKGLTIDAAGPSVDVPNTQDSAFTPRNSDSSWSSQDAASRGIFLHTVSWPTSADEDSNIRILDLPTNIGSSTLTGENTGSNFIHTIGSYERYYAQMKITFNVNTSPTYAGLLKICAFPATGNRRYNTPEPDEYDQRIFRMGGLEISAAEAGTYSMTLPYNLPMLTSPTDFSLLDQAVTQYHLVYRVLSPLKIPAGLRQNISISAFVTFENLHLFNPRAYATPFDKIINGSTLDDDTSVSPEQFHVPSQYVTTAQMEYAASHNSPENILRNDVTDPASVYPYTCGTPGDDSISAIAKIPCLLARTTWTTSQPVNYLLGQFPITPDLIAYHNENNQNIGSHPTNLSSLAAIHRYWRGTIVLRFVAVKNRLSSGSLVAYADPARIHNTAFNSVATRNSPRMLNQVGATDDFHVSIPFISSVLYKQCSRTFVYREDSEIFSSGNVILRVANPLIVNDPAFSSCSINVFISSPDIEFFEPHLRIDFPPTINDAVIAEFSRRKALKDKKTTTLPLTLPSSSTTIAQMDSPAGAISTGAVTQPISAATGINPGMGAASISFQGEPGHILQKTESISQYFGINRTIFSHHAPQTFGALWLSPVLSPWPSDGSPADFRMEYIGTALSSSFSCVHGNYTYTLHTNATMTNTTILVCVLQSYRNGQIQETERQVTKWIEYSALDALSADTCREIYWKPREGPLTFTIPTNMAYLYQVPAVTDPNHQEYNVYYNVADRVQIRRLPYGEPEDFDPFNYFVKLSFKGTITGFKGMPVINKQFQVPLLDSDGVVQLVHRELQNSTEVLVSPSALSAFDGFSTVDKSDIVALALEMQQGQHYLHGRPQFHTYNYRE